jgi:zinc protease
MKKICILLLLATGLAVPAWGDQTDSSALTTLKQSNDRLVRFSLDNGMTCLLKEDHSAPVVSIQIWVGSGSIHEGEWLGAGLSHYVEHMVFKGTPSRKPGEIAKTIIGLGGKLNAYTSLDRTVFHTDLPSRNWTEALATLADAVINASFPESEWGREKDVILREFSMGEDDPDREIQKLLFETAYTTHPYRIPVIGLRDIFKSITREDLLGFYHRRYSPDNMVAVVVGDIQPDEARKTLTAAFSSFARRANPPVFIPTEPRQTGPRQIRKAGAYNVSRLDMAFHTTTLSDPDAPALDLLAAIMGGSQSSRLVQDIKETRKLVHGINASSFTPVYPGLFSISATLDPSRENEVIKALQEAVTSWGTLSFSKNEIEKAKRLMLVNELAGLQSMHGQAASMAEGQLFMRDPRYSESYLARLQAVTAVDLQAVARKYFRPENRVTVILGPELGTASGALPAAMSQPSEVIKRVLPNGIPLILREDHRLPFIYVCATFLGGVISEDENTSGISQLMSDLLIRGTPRRSALKIAQTVETLGAELSPFAGYNSVGLRGRSLAGDADTLMDVMFDCLGNAAFPTNEVEKQKVVQLAAISAEQEEPMNIARDALNAALFAGHPYRLTLLGTPRSVTGLDQAALREYYRRQLVTGNLVIALFGDITVKDAESLVSRYIGRIRRDAAPARLGAIPSPVLPTRLEKREPREQCIVLYGFPGVSIFDPRRDPLDLLEAATGGMSSRLFETVRDKRGLAYYASTTQRFGLDSGIFTLFAGTRIDALPQVEMLIREEIERVTTKGLDPEEIARARNMILAEHEMRLQDNSGLAMMCALDELYGQGFAYEFSTRKRIEAVTPEQIKQAAISILTTNKLAISVVLPKVAK